VWLRGGRLVLGHFALRKVLLSRQAGLSFARGARTLYAKCGGGVVVWKECEVDDDVYANVTAAALEAESSMGVARRTVDPKHSSAKLGARQMGYVGTVGTKRQIAVFFNCRSGPGKQVDQKFMAPAFFLRH
jgi:hypothetical protein